MCGICGIYHYGTGTPVQIELINEMLDRIQYRGPDESGTHADRDMGFGMCRLSIIDLSSGKQPLFNETGEIAIVFNGEIYNYVELREQLLQCGHSFTTSSDTEVIVHLYEEFGDSCVDHLRGMFAFAIWDSKARRLFIARDRLGIKPLYYFQNGDVLVFGSEIKTILQYPALKAQLDLEGLNSYLALRYVPAPQTLFAGIQSLPPAHTLICDRSGIRVRSYWDLSFVQSQHHLADEQAYADQLLALLQETVKIHLRSDVPFGAFLSGGLDSSIIVGLMSQILNKPIKTFSVGFETRNGIIDERSYAQQVAQQFQTEHREIVVGAAEFIDLAEKMIWHLDQPIADQATFAVYKLSELARREVKMVLTGEGGDELFAGYARHAGERFSFLTQAIPSSARSLALSLSERLPGLRRSKLALYALCQSNETARLANWFPLFNRDMQHALLGPMLAGQVATDPASAIVARQMRQSDATNPLNRMLYLDTKLWLPDYLLLRGDKLTMAQSIESRVPLLDHKVVEFAAQLPPHLKLKGLTRKYLLKKIGANLLPPQIVSRTKKGFPIPIGQWFRHEARSFIFDLLSPSIVKRRALFDHNVVAQLLKEHDSGFANHSMLLWGLAGVELWHRVFIDSKTDSKIWNQQTVLPVLSSVKTSPKEGIYL